MINKLRILNGLYNLQLIATVFLMFGVIEFTESMCGRPGLARNCAYDNLKEEYQVGESVKYYCKSYPCLDSPEMHRRCLENGSWSGTIPFCHNSSTPDNIERISILYDGKKYNAESSLDGNRDTCISSRSISSEIIWEAVLRKKFRIIAVQAIFKDRIKENTSVLIYEKNKLVNKTCQRLETELDVNGNNILFICEKGLLGKVVRLIITRNESSDLCEVYLYLKSNYECLRPDFPYKIKGNKITDPSRYVLECSDGYKLEGDKEIVCEEDGTWSPVSSTCKKLCGELPYIANGFLRTNSTESNIAWLECAEGFKPVGDHLVHCLPTGKWTSLRLGCELIQCDPYPVIPHGRGRTLNGNAYGSRLLVTCDQGYEPIEMEPRQCHINGTWGNLNICTKITCGPLITEVADGGQWVFLNETIPIRVLICQTSYHIEGSPAVTQCLPNGSWSFTTAVCRKTPIDAACSGEWKSSNILFLAVAVGAGTAVCIICIAMCIFVIKKRRQSKTNSSVFHVSMTDSILYQEGSKEQQHYKTNTYEDVIELTHNPSSTKPRKPSSALPHLPIPPMDTDPVYAQPFETSTVFAKLAPASTASDLYNAHIYAEPVDSFKSPTGTSTFNNAAETWLRSGAKTFGRKVNIPGRASLPEDSAQQTIRNQDATHKSQSTNMSSIDTEIDEKCKSTQYEPKKHITISELINNSIYLDTKGGGFDSEKDMERLQMIDNDIYQDDYFSNV